MISDANQKQDLLDSVGSMRKEEFFLKRLTRLVSVFVEMVSFLVKTIQKMISQSARHVLLLREKLILQGIKNVLII